MHCTRTFLIKNAVFVQTKVAELKEVASTPWEKNYIEIENFEDLKYVQLPHLISRQICESKFVHIADSFRTA